MNTRPSVMARLSLGVSALLLVALGAEAGGVVRTRVVASGLGRPVGIVAGDGDVLLVGLRSAKPTAAEQGRIAELDVEAGDLVLRYSGPLAPSQVALDRDGNLYWTNASTGTIWRQDARNGTVRRVVSDLREPGGIAVDAAGRLFYTEVSGGSAAGSAGNVSMLDANGTTVLRASESAPADLAVGTSGDLYWTNAAAGTIAHLTRDGELEIVIAGLDRPQGLALDEAGNRLYFTEVPTPGVSGSAGGRNTIKFLDLATRELTVLHRGDPEPADVAISSSGRIFWTSTRSGQVIEASEDDDEDGDEVELEARLTGGQEVPPVESEASGRVKLKLITREEEDDDDDDVSALKPGSASAPRHLRGEIDRHDDDEDDAPRLEYRLKLKKITGATQGHLHLGAPGVNGPIVVTLFALQERPGDDEKLNIAGVVSPDELVGPFAGDWDGFVAALIGGQLYANVHTGAHPGGEIRGQVLPKGTGGNHPPNGVILTPAEDISVAAGVPVSFAGAASDPDGDMVSVVWDFGDGTGSTALVPPDHVYAERGEYRVKLTATDSRGLSDPSPDRREIKVTLQPPGTPSPTPTVTPPAPTPTPTVPGPTATPTPTMPGPTATPTPTTPPPTPTPTVPGPTATPTPTTPPPTPTPTMPPPTPTPTMPRPRRLRQRRRRLRRRRCRLR